MIRAVLDTNILVSAGITANGDCDQIVRAALRGELRIAVCPGIVDEYLEILNRSKFTRYRFPPAWLKRLLANAERYAQPANLPSIPDPEDQVFLALAQEAGLLVTGNLKDFPEADRGPAEVLDPWAFLARLSGRPTTQ